MFPLRGVLALLLMLVLAGLGPAHGDTRDWAIAFHASADLSCDQLDAVLQRKEWHADDVDAIALAASSSLWLRLTPLKEPAPSVLVARRQIASEWVDYRDPLAPRRTSFRAAPDSAAPGLLGVTLPHGRGATAGVPVYLCLHDRLINASAVHPQAIALMPAAEFRAVQQRGFTILGSVMGVMLAMAALSLVFYVGLRERVFADYFVYILCFAVYVLHSSDALGWLFPLAMRDGPAISLTAMVTMPLMILFGLRFTLAYTGMGEAWPRWSRVSMIFAWLAVGAALLSTAGLLQGEQGLALRRVANLLFNALAALIILSIVVGVVEQAWRGRPEARVYLLGWTPPLLVLLGYILRFLGITPDSLRPSSTLLMQAAAFESLILGWGIAERARHYRLARDEALHVASHDPLTGALNRDAFERVMDQALNSPSGASLLFLDIDHFKAINDRHGHAVGDQVLRRLVQRCQSELRGVDALARLGGEEFVAMLTDTDSDEALRVAERIRVAINQDSEAPVPSSVSIGVASRAAGESAASWLARADQALYAAKHAGRNRVMEAG